MTYIEKMKQKRTEIKQKFLEYGIKCNVASLTELTFNSQNLDKILKLITKSTISKTNASD